VARLFILVEGETEETFVNKILALHLIGKEFEALLFSDCTKFAAGIGRSDLAARFQEVRSEFNSPEDINDSPLTHPSQRVVDVVPEYQKPLFGNLAALEIGFEPMCRECSHFRAWLERLERLTR
jgi:hypothetical protein